MFWSSLGNLATKRIKLILATGLRFTVERTEHDQVFEKLLKQLAKKHLSNQRLVK